MHSVVVQILPLGAPVSLVLIAWPNFFQSTLLGFLKGRQNFTTNLKSRYDKKKISVRHTLPLTWKSQRLIARWCQGFPPSSHSAPSWGIFKEQKLVSFSLSIKILMQIGSIFEISSNEIMLNFTPFLVSLILLVHKLIQSIPRMLRCDTYRPLRSIEVGTHLLSALIGQALINLRLNANPRLRDQFVARISRPTVTTSKTWQSLALCSSARPHYATNCAWRWKVSPFTIFPNISFSLLLCNTPAGFRFFVGFWYFSQPLLPGKPSKSTVTATAVSNFETSLQLQIHLSRWDDSIPIDIQLGIAWRTGGSFRTVDPEWV